MHLSTVVQRTISRLSFAILALSFFAAGVRPVVAQDTWLLQISEKENQLVHPSDPMWMKSNMWDVSYQRMNDRNMPVLELTNLQPAGGPDISTFEMTIGDTRFHFADDYLGAYAVLGNSTPGFQLTSTANGGNLLKVNIVGGLSPGETVRFKIDLDVDDGLPFFAHPDYRTVLFDMNGINVYGDDPQTPNNQEDNAQATVTFSNNTTNGPVAFIDEDVDSPAGQYYNNIFRPYGVMEPVDIFDIGGGPNVIPEPSSALLALAGLIGSMWVTGRPRRA
jgi:hypothetical protein